MRIGLVTGEYPPTQGGVGAYTHILAHELAKQGNDVYVFSNRGTQGDSKVPVENSVQRWGIGSLRTIRRWAVEKQLDIVNLQFQTAAFSMSPWIHFLPEVLEKPPLVTTFHDLRFPYLFPKAGWLRDWIVMRLARQSDGVIVTNHEDNTRLQSVAKTMLIPIGSNILNPVPTDFDAQFYRQKAGVQPGDFFITYFGLLNRSKGLEVLLEAVAELKVSGSKLRMLMIGSAGTSDPTNALYAQEIGQMIARLGLRDTILETGYLDEEMVGAYLSASDAVVLPFLDGASYRRGSLMAAIQYKTAILTTIPQVAIPAFKSGENMLMVKAGDAAAIATGIRQLSDSPALRATLREGAGELSKLFQWSQIARNTLQYFHWVTEESA